MVIEYGTNETWAYHTDIGAIVFTIVVHGKVTTCKVFRETIEGLYGACESEMEVLDKAKENFDEITDRIGFKAHRKQFEEDGSIVL